MSVKARRPAARATGQAHSTLFRRSGGEWKCTSRTVLPPPMGQPLLPDLPNWAWHEYGMRVGFWRLLDVLRHHPDARDQRQCLQHVPAHRGGGARRGLGVQGHGFVQVPMHRLDDQR